MRTDASALCLLAASAFVPVPGLGVPLPPLAAVAERGQSLLDRLSASVAGYHHFRLPPAISLPYPPTFATPEAAPAPAPASPASPVSASSPKKHGLWRTRVMGGRMGLRGWRTLFFPTWPSRPVPDEAGATAPGIHHNSAQHDKIIPAAVLRFYAHGNKHQRMQQQQQQEQQHHAVTASSPCSQRSRLSQSPDRIAVILVVSFLVFVVMVETGKTACQRMQRSLSGRGAIRLVDNDDEESVSACACQKPLLPVQAAPAAAAAAMTEPDVPESRRGAGESEKRDS